MSDVPAEWIEAFGEGWHSVPEGEPGDRRRAGLRAVEPLIRADEDERVAQAIEAGCVHRRGFTDDRPPCYHCAQSALIARNGGRNE